MSKPRLDSAALARQHPPAAWPGFLLRGALLALTTELVAAAVARVVLAVDPGVLAAEPLGRALGRGALIAAGAALVMLVLHALVGLILRVLRRARPEPKDNDAERPEIAWLLMLAVGGPWALTHWSFGVVHRDRAFDLPVLSRAVSAYLPGFVAVLAAEVLLRSGRLARGARAPWWLLRGLLGVAWALLLLALIGGPDILRGDALEWGTRLRDAALSQEWLNRAPRAPSRGWPALQLGAMVALLLTLLAAAREFWLAWRAWRTRVAQKPGATAEAKPTRTLSSP